VRNCLILFIILFLSSCAQKPEEKINEAIDRALTHLSSGECDAAIDVLEDSGGGNSDAIYIQVLSSAYACKADFNEIAFISDDLTDIDASSSANILKSMSIMSLSDESAADSANYTNVRTAINTILNTTSPIGQTERTAKFGTRKAGDLGVQALILNIVNFGKFLNFYGNVSGTGVKGGGAASNSCFLNYNDPRAQALTGVSTGACTVDNDGSIDLDQTTAVGKRRICEGAMLLTNAINILDNLDLSNSSTLSKLEDISSQVNSFKTAATAAGLGTIINMTSQSQCETFLNTPAQLLDMEYFYALVFETGLQ
jgi:hypothetical protein